MNKKEQLGSNINEPKSRRERLASVLSARGSEYDPTPAELDEFDRVLREVRRKADRVDAPSVARAFRAWAEMAETVAGGRESSSAGADTVE